MSQASSKTSFNWTRSLLLVIFLFSGATSLVYETLWSRQLHLVFGVSQLAIATLLAAFMAGLALGGFFAARWAGRIKRPLLVYAGLEAFIGLYALAFPYILQASTPLYLSFWRTYEPSPLGFGIFQFLLQGVLLLPPTILMGATLPVLSRFVARSNEEAGAQIGRLYGANTIGAVIGTGLAGFYLLPTFGLHTTTVWTAAANGVLALAAAALSAGAIPLEKDASGQAALPDEFDAVHRKLWLIAALAGFAALLSEVAWFRLIGLLIGGSAYAFSVMLLAFLLGIGLGGWAGGPAADRSYRAGGRALVLKHLGLIQIAVASFAYLAMWAYGELPFVFAQLFTWVEENLVWLWPAKITLSLTVMLPPALFMGATFPYIVRAAAGDPDKLNQPVGRIYGMNTLGSILGAALGGLFLLPALQVQGSVLFASSVNLINALLALTALGAAGKIKIKSREYNVPIYIVVLILLFQVARPPWNPLLMTSGIFQYVSDMKPEQRTRGGILSYYVSPYELLYYEEGLSTVVTVAKKWEGSNIWMANNGKVDASSHSDFDTQVLISHIPLSLKPAPQKTLVIGYASGITLGAVTLHEQVGGIDVVELEPAIIRGSKYFADYNFSPLEDPRVNLILNDGRNHLLLAEDQTYDLIISEPSNPWLSGVSNLFTDEFYKMGKTKLKPGGVWAQWVQMYAMVPEDVQSLLKTFAGNYQHVLLFRINQNDLLMVGSEEPIPLDIASFEPLFENDEIRTQMYRSKIEFPEDVLGLFAFDQDAILEMQALVNSDDNMRIEYSAPLHLHDSTRKPNNIMLGANLQIPWQALNTPEDYIALGKAYAYYDYVWDRAVELMRKASEIYPDNLVIKDLFQEYSDEAGN